jgi:hypothetical protein
VLGVDTSSGETTIEPAPAEAESYRPYILAQMKRLKQVGRANFGIVVGKRGAEHRMAMHPTRSARAMSASLTHDTGLRLSTWGVAEPHPDKPATLVLSLEGKPLAGLGRKGESMLRAFRPLPFARVEFRMDGAALADDPDPDDEPNDPVSVLPPAPAAHDAQADALATAARQGKIFCEECPPR